MSALFLRTLLVVVITLLPALASAQGLRVLARVNDDAITDFDLQQRVLFAIRTTGLQDSPDLRQRMAAQMLRQIIESQGELGPFTTFQKQPAKRALGLEEQLWRFMWNRKIRYAPRSSPSSCATRAPAS